MLISGVALLVAFMLWEWKGAKNPLIPIQVFASRTSRAALTVACCHSFVFIGFDFYLALYFQAVLGATFLTGMVIRKTGKVKLIIWFGAFFMTLGTGLFINFGPKMVVWKIIVFQIIAGIGVGPLFQAPMIALQSVVKQRDVAAANSAFSFLRSLVTSLSVVIGGVVLQRGLGSSSLTGNGHVSAGGGETSVRYANALSNMWIFYTAFCAVMLIATIWIGKIDLGSKSRKAESDDTAVEETSVVEETVTVQKNADPSKVGTEMTERKTEI
jgi:hypothetical protein